MKKIGDSTPIITPDGWRIHGNLQPGDQVFSSDGSPTKILSVSNRSLCEYEIEFSNGEIIKCHGGHLWSVYDRWNKQQGVDQLRTYSIKELLDRGPIRDKRIGKKERARYSLPDFQSCEFKPQELPLHPYYLGCWLGDGTSSSTLITHDINDSEHIRKLESLDYQVTGTMIKGNTCRSRFSYQNIVQTLMGLNLYKNKHIPPMYLMGSLTQRLELLAGLIDTDGNVHKRRGQVSIVTVNKEFAQQIHRLCHSCGFRANIVSRKAPGYNDPKYGFYPSNKTAYTVRFNPNISIPTAIPRKKIKRLDAVRRRVTIVDIRKSKIPEMGQCIAIEHPSRLYLVGEKCLVTHNSLTTNVFWPSWEWGPQKRPSLRYVCASYSQDLTHRDNRKTQNLVKSKWYQDLWGDQVTIDPNQDSKTRFDNMRTGFKIATSIGGLGTGERGDRFIVDDPHNIREGESEKKLKAALHWWREVVPTRLNNPIESAIIVIMQRVNERDVSGSILENELDGELGYTHLMLPMEYDPKRSCVVNRTGFKDPRTEENELLWPERMPRRVVERDKKVMGSYASASQYQQNPSPRGEGIFKVNELKYVDIAPDMAKTVRGWDLAATDKGERGGSGAAYTAGVKMGMDKEGRVYILHAKRFKKDAKGVEDEIKAAAISDGYLCDQDIPQDPGQAGKALKQSYAILLHGFNVYFSPESGNKEVRALPFAAQIEAGNVYMVRGNWNGDFLDELAVFPVGKFKDQVDACSRAYARLIPKGQDSTICGGEEIS